MKHFSTKKGRFYPAPDGNNYPSVSTVLGIISAPELMYWYGAKGTKEANRIKNEAGDIGGTAHKYINKFAYGFKISEEEWSTLDDRVKNALKAYIRWQKSSNFNPIYTEYTIYSDSGYAGTLDAIGYSDDKIILVDYKTSNSYHKSNELQIAAYWKAFMEMNPNIVIEEGRCIMLDKISGVPEIHVLNTEQLEIAYHSFLSALDLWRYINGE